MIWTDNNYKKPVTNSQLTETVKMLRSYHFWIIIVITSVIIFIYYEYKTLFPWFYPYFVIEFRNDVIGFLLFIPFVYASLVFWWRGPLIVWMISSIAMFPLLLYYAYNIESFMTNVTISFVPPLVVIVIALELNWRHRQKQIAVEREKERQVYMSQIFKAQENERQRIAQELHDDTTQELLVLANRTQVLAHNVDLIGSRELTEETEDIRDKILDISKDVRRLSLDLRPSILDEIGLVSALRWLADRLNQETDINTRVVVAGIVKKLSPEVEVIIFRIAQEALNNIRWHSNASKAEITAQFTPGVLTLKIMDNGDGFHIDEALNDAASKGKLGIIGMQQRAKFINGIFKVASQPGEGTVITLKITYSNEPE